MADSVTFAEVLAAGVALDEVRRQVEAAQQRTSDAMDPAYGVSVVATIDQWRQLVHVVESLRFTLAAIEEEARR